MVESESHGVNKKSRCVGIFSGKCRWSVGSVGINCHSHAHIFMPSKGACGVCTLRLPPTARVNCNKKNPPIGGFLILITCGTATRERSIFVRTCPIGCKTTRCNVACSIAGATIGACVTLFYRHPWGGTKTVYIIIITAVITCCVLMILGITCCAGRRGAQSITAGGTASTGCPWNSTVAQTRRYRTIGYYVGVVGSTTAAGAR